MFFASGFLRASFALCCFPLSLIYQAICVPKGYTMTISQQSIIFLIFSDLLS